MIDPKELRIGNLVQLDIIQLEVNGLFLSHFKARNEHGVEVNSAQDNITPITLSEEWLLKLGLKPNSDKSIYEFIKRPQWEDITVRFYEGKFSIWLGDAPMIDIEIEYVNRLQNLYFALTGEELKPKA